MKNLRQAKMLELIKDFDIDTQEELQRQLGDAGFFVTQATVSRDIRELGIVKVSGDDGVYKYRANTERERGDIANKFSLILRQAAFHVAYANNLIVVKTYAGMGSAAGAAIDAMNLEGTVGTLAGDDTLLIIAQNNECAESITNLLSEMIGKQKA